MHCTRIVIFEKYSRASMLRWIVKQKYKSIKNNIFEDAAKWRDMELFLIGDDKFYRRGYSDKEFDILYFDTFHKAQY